ncbi:MAG: TIGR03751 family conjugal transfer lipoprotein [Gammaproteobacteria bacterium]|nr:TIGR03751 family conjugal transfer lipoprotein [Gammaproteobacteria bacterium]
MTWISARQRIRQGMVGLVCLALAGCAGPSAQQIFDAEGPSLKSRYGRALHGNRPVSGMSSGQDDGYTRSAEKELDQLFPELPNPRLALYVFPHLTAGGAPIPGYTTAFYLYDHQRIFALPGEVAP